MNDILKEWYEQQIEKKNCMLESYAYRLKQTTQDLIEAQAIELQKAKEIMELKRKIEKYEEIKESDKQ